MTAKSENQLAESRISWWLKRETRPSILWMSFHLITSHRQQFTLQVLSVQLKLSQLTSLRNARSRVSMPAGVRGFYPLQNIQTSSGAHPVSYSVRTRIFFPPRDKQPEREVAISPPSSAEVKNGWSWTSTPVYDFMMWTGTYLPFTYNRFPLYSVSLSAGRVMTAHDPNRYYEL
jgi:hypothetical protein